MSDLQKPGEKPATTGEYRETGPRGGAVKNARIVTIDRGDSHLPPTQEPARKWQPVPTSKHKHKYSYLLGIQ